MEIIALFFPACISVWIYHQRNARVSWRVLPTLIEYGIWTVCNVLLSVLVIVFVFRRTDITSEALRGFSFFWKYMLVAVLTACLMPYLVEAVSKCFGVTLVMEMEREQKEKKDGRSM